MTITVSSIRSCDRCGNEIPAEEFRHEVVLSTFMPGSEEADHGERADVCHLCWLSMSGALLALLTTAGSFVHLPESA